jgi:hypothetical protein
LPIQNEKLSAKSLSNRKSFEINALFIVAAANTIDPDFYNKTPSFENRRPTFAFWEIFFKFRSEILKDSESEGTESTPVPGVERFTETGRRDRPTLEKTFKRIARTVIDFNLIGNP